VTDDRLMHQVAPYPDALARLVKCLRYRQHLGWEVRLEDDLQRDKPGRHSGEARGLTLVVTRCGPDSYHHDRTIAVNHYFAVPAATYNLASWQRWLLDRLGDVDTHERMEDFVVADSPGSEHAVRPFAPNHGPGCDPYRIVEYATEEDRRTSFRGELNPR
jgi:hypothetical protein